MPATKAQLNNNGLSPRELSVLLEISRVITSSLPLRNMFEVIQAYLEEIIALKVGVLYIKEKGRLNLKVGVGAGVDEKILFSLGKNAGSNYLLKKIKATGRTWRSSQIIDLERLKKHPYYVNVLSKIGVLYTAGAPIREGHKILGSIHWGRGEEAGDFSDRELLLLEIVANLFSPTIKNIIIRKNSWQVGAVAGADENKPNGGCENPANVNDQPDQKMDVLGSVSKVMAKELRHPLSNLKMSFYSLARNFTSGVMAQQDLEQMDRSIKNMDKTIGFLLNLAHDLNLKREWLDVNDLLDEVLETLGPIMDPDIVVVKDYAPSVKLFMDREKMHAVFGNIVENALDAMPGGGRLRIITTEDQGRSYIIVEDSGLGVAKEIQHSIFDPFVSGKANGVGLGLTVCRKVVESHGGKIMLRSTSGKGTAVCIDMPNNQNILKVN
ncbi:GAF domain-containing sensor histidine kinase [Desulfallas thermosapovorans]|uniref:histidine kinase n=1 Tax=Desulfallas thermosapovorans DSM 6562 TaxID=1121431 RepID=A0A5S4ZV70_9FIRM|nr:GAF domain-containing sensor histidine kinase [Desulfallas thermosapovorans]TYO96002.1 histidine kinase/DNA gyrase B/HSP90-like ATPase [Desulfallas thermosapovorans DSM 6562]